MKYVCRQVFITEYCSRYIMVQLYHVAHLMPHARLMQTMKSTASYNKL